MIEVEKKTTIQRYVEKIKTILKQFYGKLKNGLHNFSNFVMENIVIILILMAIITGIIFIVLFFVFLWNVVRDMGIELGFNEMLSTSIAWIMVIIVVFCCCCCGGIGFRSKK